MLIVFLLDTSASMNQRCANGLTLLDCAKSAIEHFHKVRLRDASCRMDRYMLVTCEEGPDVIKVLDKYPFTNFMRTLKSMKARDLTNIGASMQRIFGFLHVQRLASDIDKFGQGRNPCFFDPTTIMLLTDGTELTTLSGVAQTLLPSGPVPVGADLSMQPFRWDQRVFATVLRIPSVSTAMLERSGPIPQNAPISGSQTAVAMDNNISAFCEFTGGKCFVATSWKVLMQHTEVTATRLPSCVIVSFEHMPLPHSTNLPPQVHAACQRKMMFVRGGPQGHWPIPEAYLWDASHPGLPPREAHPVIVYKAVDADPQIPTNFIFDKYEIESNPIMGFLLKAPAGVCWQVYIRNSKGPNNGYGDPFGYLRLNRVGSTLTLYVLPYNYPVLWQLLEQFGKMPAGSVKHPPLPQWRQDMERYCHSIPPYYGNPLRKALKRWGIQAHVVPDSMDSAFYTSVGTQLERLKSQASEELSADMARILSGHQNGGPKTGLRGRRLSIGDSTASPNAEVPPGFNNTANCSPGGSWAPISESRGIGHGDHAQMRKGSDFIPTTLSASSLAGIESGTGLSMGPMKDMPLFKNPFDVPVGQLIRQLQFFPLRVAMAFDSSRKSGRDSSIKAKSSPLSLLAARVLAKEEDEARHSLPIEKMGDFNEALMKQQPPRNPFAEDQDRSKQPRPMFGNPYRQEKNDGADEAWLEGTGGNPLRGRKRRKRAESPSISGASLTSAGTAGESMSEGTSVSAEVTSPTRPSESQNLVSEVLKSAISADPSKCRGKAGDLRTSEPPIVLLQRESTSEYLRHSSNGSDAIGLELPEEKKSATFIVEARTNPQLPERPNNALEEEASVFRNAAPNPLTEEPTRPRKKRRVLVVTPIGTEKEQGEVAEFLVSVIRVLRKTKSDNTEKLFELLSIPDFPVDKLSFVDQLICQAQRMNKLGVTKELQDYSTGLLNPTKLVEK